MQKTELTTIYHSQSTGQKAHSCVRTHTHTFLIYSIYKVERFYPFTLQMQALKTLEIKTFLMNLCKQKGKHQVTAVT